MNMKLKVYTKRNSKPIVGMDLVEVHLFYVEHMFKQIMVVLI
jgi:hypothetical protein